jgi:hypothetical protein
MAYLCVGVCIHVSREPLERRLRRKPPAPEDLLPESLIGRYLTYARTYSNPALSPGVSQWLHKNQLDASSWSTA